MKKHNTLLESIDRFIDIHLGRSGIASLVRFGRRVGLTLSFLLVITCSVHFNNSLPVRSMQEKEVVQIEVDEHLKKDVEKALNLSKSLEEFATSMNFAAACRPDICLV